MNLSDLEHVEEELTNLRAKLFTLQEKAAEAGVKRH